MLAIVLALYAPSAHAEEFLSDRITASKLTECSSSIGNRRLCACLSEYLPLGMSFSGYVSIIGLSNSELDYDHMDQHDQEVLMQARRAKTMCGRFE